MSDIIVTEAALPPVEGLQLSEVAVRSTRDGPPQPLIIGVPDRPSASPTPLLVGLHTWSADYHQQVEAFGPLCAQYGWLMALPDFRGANLTSNPHARQAGGSILAQHDIVDAVATMRQQHEVDERRIYLIGGSGGGHMSLLMAGKHPDIWAGVSSWCPVTSLPEWHAQQNGYAVHCEAVCGGAPGESPAVDFEYERRSPRSFITNAAHTNVRISHGDKDRCIFIAQSWRTYEKLLDLPHRVEFYSWSGGHEIVNAWGFAWLGQQVKPAEAPRRQSVVTDEGKWYAWVYLEPDAPLTMATCEAVLAEDGVLDLAVTHSALTQMRLADLPVGALAGAERDGEAVALETLPQDEGIVRLPPCAETTRWRLRFDAKTPV